MSIESFIIWCLERKLICIINPGNDEGITAVIEVYSKGLNSSYYTAWNGDRERLSAFTEQLSCMFRLS